MIAIRDNDAINFKKCNMFIISFLTLYIASRIVEYLHTLTNIATQKKLVIFVSHLSSSAYRRFGKCYSLTILNSAVLQIGGLGIFKYIFHCHI